MTRDQAYQLMCEWTQSESLRKHMLAVEAAMRFYAHKFDEDEEKWAVVGLLHDMDYEKHPSKEEHPYQTVSCCKHEASLRTSFAPSLRMPITPACQQKRRWRNPFSRWMSFAVFLRL